MLVAACEDSLWGSLAPRSSFLSIPYGPNPLSQNTFGSTQVEVSEGQWHANLRLAISSFLNTDLCTALRLSAETNCSGEGV